MMTEDIWVNIDKHDSDLFERMGGKTGELYINVAYKENGCIDGFYMLLYLDGTVTENTATLVRKGDNTFKLYPCEKYSNALKKEFGNRIWECELFCNDQYDGIGEKNLLLHLL